MAIFGLFKKDKSKASVASSSSVAADDDASTNDHQLRARRSLALLSPRNLDDGYASSSTSFVSATSAKKPRRLPFAKKTPLANQASLSTLGNKSADTHLSPPRKLTLNLDSSASSLPTHSPVFPSFHHTGSSPALSKSARMDAHTPPRPQARPMQQTDSPSSQKSNGGLFGWRERKRSKPSIPDGALSIPPLSDDSSFNLKSFRHVLPPERATVSPPPGSSPTQSLSKNTLVPPARPRGASVASADSSQRISVAAFREAQARRSSTNLTSGSPSPTIRPLSVATSSISDLALSRQANPPVRARTPSASPSCAPRPTSTFKNNLSKRVSQSTDTSSEEDSEDEDESPSRPCSRLSRQRTITKSYRAKSDLGHERAGAEHSGRRQRQETSSHSELGHGLPSRPPRVTQPSHSPARGPPPSSFQKTAETVLGTRSHNLYKQQRGSYSAHELNPTSAARRASAMQKHADSGNPPKSPAMDSTDTSESSSESGSSDEDAPLATLAQPRRPPSAMSTASTTTNATSRKPLINLNTKSNPITGKPLMDEKENTEPAPTLISPTNINSRLSKLTAAAGLGVQVQRSSIASKSVESFSNTSHLRPSFADRPQPISPSSTDTVTPPILTASPEPIEQTVRRDSMASVPTLEDGQRMKADDFQPVPVRSRENPSGFRVVSRPLKPASEPPPPSSAASVPTISHHAQRPSLGARSVTSSSQSNSAPRAQSNIPPLKTQPLLLPSKDSTPFASASTSRQSIVSSSSASSSRPGVQNALQRPLLMETRRRDSPASSTGGSSTGPAPLTPADGSDYFSPGVRGNGESPDSSRSTPQSAMKGGRGHMKRASVSFQENVPELDHDATVRGRKSSHSLAKSEDMSVEERENRRRDRRRSEAKAAIELGNVVNGKGPQIADEDDDDEDFFPNASSPQPVAQSNGGAYFGQMPMGWSPQAMPQQPMMTGMPNMNMMGTPVMGMNMVSPQQFMITPPPLNADPAYLAAHQQAMLVAKQAYQYAVAQQAMQAAGEEWERGSSVSGFAPSSTMSTTGMPGYAMNAMWNSSTPMFPSAPRSMYAGSIYGGAPSEANWGTASVYGESFGPANQRASRINAHKRNSSGSALGMAMSPGNATQTTLSPPATSRSGPRPRVKTAPSNANLPPQHRNSQIPPSSWKIGS